MLRPHHSTSSTKPHITRFLALPRIHSLIAHPASGIHQGPTHPTYISLARLLANPASRHCLRLCSVKRSFVGSAHTLRIAPAPAAHPLLSFCIRIDISPHLLYFAFQRDLPLLHSVWVTFHVFTFHVFTSMYHLLTVFEPCSTLSPPLLSNCPEYPDR